MPITSSVAIATYNGEKYIIEQLKSIESQTTIPDEIIISDDCSTDKTVQLINNYALNSKLNIKVIINSNNLGFRKNFEKCISLCQKDIIFFCDQDDVWKENKVELFINEFQKNPNTVYAFSDAYVTNESLGITHESIWELLGIEWNKMDLQMFFDTILTRNFPLGFSAAVKKTYIHSIMPFQIDHDGWAALCAPAFGNISSINEKLVYYRRHNQATSNAARTIKTSKINSLKSIFKDPYFKHWTWTNCEYDNYSFVLKMIKNNNIKINTDKLCSRLEYLEKINSARERNFIYRINCLIKLKKNGQFQAYRAKSNKTFILDCAFMFVNSFKSKKNR